MSGAYLPSVAVTRAAERRILHARSLGLCADVCPDATKPGVVCLLDPGHEGEHRDRVLSIEWFAPATPEGEQNA